MLKRPVFEGKESKEVLKRNVDCNINFEAQIYQELPLEAVDLLKRMLAKQPGQRITAEQALEHPFVNRERRELEV